VTGASNSCGCFSLSCKLARLPAYGSQEDKEHEHDSSISSVGIEREGVCDMDMLQQWLGGLLREKGADLFRSKGVLAVQGSNDRYGLACSSASSKHHLQSRAFQPMQLLHARCIPGAQCRAQRAPACNRLNSAPCLKQRTLCRSAPAPHPH
jgi:G3E family GTPase